MHKSARNDRFKQALFDNIRCETGANGGVAHTQMAENFMSSIGLMVSMKDVVYSAAVSRALEENNFLKKATEPTRAGFMFATEALFPLMLKVVRPAIILHYPDADMQYIDEHIQVDADEHSEWMKESVKQILSSSRETFDEIITGMNFAMHGALYPFESIIQGGLVVAL
jgi:pyrroloquinoline quinone (PQQ) biosynthesis protein C